MPLICYQPKRFDASSAAIINQTNQILDKYRKQGYDLTLRQIYYQFIGRDIFPDDRWWLWVPATRKWVHADANTPGATKNAEPNYKWLGGIINDARLAGTIDWASIADRTRNLQQNAHWDSPHAIVEACASQFQIDKWASQKNYIEVWVEKDALVGLLEAACRPLDVPYFSCRGYTSQSEVWGASQRLLEKVHQGKRIFIIHLGDHDPSGIDMSRDILDRLTLFLSTDLWVAFMKRHRPHNGEDRDEYLKRLSMFPGAQDIDNPIKLRRIALNMDQVEHYKLPPSPAKLTDSRCQRYMGTFGDDSWELDALEPSTITGLIATAVLELRDETRWRASKKAEEAARSSLKAVAQNWQTAVKAAQGKKRE
jgi:hypothetical protein